MPLARVSTVASETRWHKPLNARDRIAQTVNRISFGRRPGDAERITALGAESFINEQLHPERLDDAAVETRLAVLPTALDDCRRVDPEVSSLKTV